MTYSVLVSVIKLVVVLSTVPINDAEVFLSQIAILIDLNPLPETITLNGQVLPVRRQL
jgi:hypothetical protein